MTDSCEAQLVQLVLRSSNIVAWINHTLEGHVCVVANDTLSIVTVVLKFRVAEALS